MSNPQGFEFYYVIFTCGHGQKGSLVIKQAAGPDGFNLAEAHRFIVNQLGHLAMIDDYKSITEKRYTDMKDYEAQVQAMLGQTESSTKPNFTVHQGGKNDDGDSH